MSEASIGSVGSPSRRCETLHIPCSPRTGSNDLVLNEVRGTAMTIGFQWLDKHVQKQIERQDHSRALIDTHADPHPPAPIVGQHLSISGSLVPR